MTTKKRYKNATISIAIVVILVIAYVLEMRNIGFLENYFGPTSTARIRNIMDGVVSTFAIALLVYLFRDKIVAIISPKPAAIVTYFNDLEDCLRYLAEGISNFEEKTKMAHITVVTPLILSEEYIAYYCGEKKEKRTNCLKYYYEYNRIFRSIIETGERGAYDRLIVGKTNIAEIDEPSTLFVKNNYFKDGFPDTSELGWHENLNEFAVHIFAESMGEISPSLPKHNKFAMQIHFSSDFKEVYGFICQSDEAVDRIAAFVNFKFAEIKTKSAFFVREDKAFPFDENSFNLFKDHFLSFR